MLIMQGDVQLVTGLSIIVAALANIYRDDETPLYHIFIARALAGVTVVSKDMLPRSSIFIQLSTTWSFEPLSSSRLTCCGDGGAC